MGVAIRRRYGCQTADSDPDAAAPRQPRRAPVLWFRCGSCPADDNVWPASAFRAWISAGRGGSRGRPVIPCCDACLFERYARVYRSCTACGGLMYFHSRKSRAGSTPICRACAPDAVPPGRDTSRAPVPPRDRGDVAGQKARWRKRCRERVRTDPAFAEKWRAARRAEKRRAYERKHGAAEEIWAGPRCLTCRCPVGHPNQLYCATAKCNPHIRKSRGARR